MTRASSTHTRGTVTSTAPLLVQLDDAVTATPATRYSGYSPVVADRVVVLVLGSSLIIQDREVA